MATTHRLVPWPMTLETYQEFLTIDEELQSAAQDHDSLRLQAAIDAMRSLPHCPFPVAQGEKVQPRIVLDPDRDRLQRVHSIPAVRPPNSTLH